MSQLIVRPVGGTEAEPHYRIDLPNGEYAMIVPTGGVWSLSLYKASAKIEDRGLFGKPFDAIQLLESELTANDPRHPLMGRGTRRVGDA